ncbi:bacillithiol system redox-active protein YtxJ [Ammoniphilus sp. CFH 90114]|uniref:bacillithiol system redox-active protein YtxJ n=1 Tax=Ammoniphilus sp. CFH 90114 TaxID=2493665 RepID=UPI00196B6E24|nr:bacillithiol system redox-active protein YtxJ [Ammoniphilus sp. CFH 90114]
MKKWSEISSLDEWRENWEASGEHPVVIFKHSTACPVSAEALREYEQYISKISDTEVKYLLVKVIESRPISNQIAEDCQVKHESPQALVIKNKQVTWSASHWKITESSLKQAIDG